MKRKTFGAAALVLLALIGFVLGWANRPESVPLAPDETISGVPPSGEMIDAQGLR